MADLAALLHQPITLAQIEAAQLYQKQRKYYTYFPDLGPLRRELYVKHMQFIAAGATVSERLFVSANRSGKTETGSYETTTHAMGEYPSWWPGKRFKGPIEGWIANTNWDTVRDINQTSLLGPADREESWGTGMIPYHKILDIDKNPHVKNGVMLIKIRYRDSKSECSVLQFKNYEQGRQSFQGTSKHWIWADEECPRDVYEEMLLRTMTCDGQIALTYTPIMGMTGLTKDFLENRHPGRVFIMAGWDDAPHLTADAKQKMALSIEPNLRDARMKGLPSMGLGLVFPISEDLVKVPDFEIPDHYVRCGGFDTGWKFTAGVWLARNNDTGVTYLYDCYKASEEKPPVHAEALKSRGAWIPFAGDCAAVSTVDGEKMLEIYQGLGVIVSLPDKRSKNANIQAVWLMLSTGKLKIFASCVQWFEEFRLYHRKSSKEGNDEDGKIVKTDDHLMDATQYGVVSGLPMARVKPIPRPWILPQTTAWS